MLYVLSSIKILREYERAVIFRLGKLLSQPKGPGVVLVFAPIDRMVRVSLRTVVLDVPPQDIITRDNVSVKVNAVVFFRVVDPRMAIVEVENYNYATSQLAQTTLRSVLGQAELDDLLAQRERLNQQLQQILDHQTDPWGVKVSAVEVKHVDLPADMQRAIARQAEAEREKRAKIIHAEGELIASEKLSQAAGVMHQEPLAITLRYLQTLTEISAEKNSTIIFPLPIDLLQIIRSEDLSGWGAPWPSGYRRPDFTHNGSDSHSFHVRGRRCVSCARVARPPAWHQQLRLDRRRLPTCPTPPTRSASGCIGSCYNIPASARALPQGSHIGDAASGHTVGPERLGAHRLRRTMSPHRPASVTSSSSLRSTACCPTCTSRPRRSSNGDGGPRPRESRDPSAPTSRRSAVDDSVQRFFCSPLARV